MNLQSLKLQGLQLVDPNADYSGDQVVYLDFDGEQNVTYNNPALGLTVSDITVSDSGLTDDQISDIVEKLNTTFANTGVTFTVTAPKDEEYSTIYVGKTFSTSGDWESLTTNFQGLAETIDVGNQIKNDNAFVFSNKVNSTATITETITHEAAHLLGYRHVNTETTFSINDYAATLTGYLLAGVMSYNPVGSDRLAILAQFQPDTASKKIISDGIQGSLYNDFIVVWDIDVRDKYLIGSGELTSHSYKTTVSRSLSGVYTITREKTSWNTYCDTITTSSLSDAIDYVCNIGERAGDNGGIAFIKLNETSDITDAYVECRFSIQSPSKSSDLTTALFYAEGDYYFNIRGTADKEPNQNINAKSMSGTTISGSIDYDEDYDVFSKVFYAGVKYQFTVTGFPLVDLTGGKQGFTRFAYISNNSTWTCDSTDTYYIAIHSGGVCDYTLSVSKIPESITISEFVNILEGDTLSYKCTVKYGDGSSEIVTSDTSWTINSSSYAAIDSTGKLTTKSVTSDKSIKVTATYKNLTATDDITIKDTTPAAPSSLTVTVDSSSQISLKWTDASTNETNFYIERKGGSDNLWRVVGTNSENDRTYTDKGLVANTTYSYRVRAYNSGSIGDNGYSDYSNIGSGTTPSLPTPQDICILGGGNNNDSYEIADGDMLPRTDDNTDFGAHTVNSSLTTKTFTIKNTGGSILSISSFSLDGSSDFKFTNGNNLKSLDATKSSSFSIQFVPSSSGTKECVVTIKSDDPDGEGTYTFVIQGNGTAVTQPDLEVSGNSHDFGSSDTSWSFKVGNNSSGTTLSYSISCSASWVKIGSYDGKATSANEDTVTLTIDRSKLSTGTNTATITVVNSNNASDKETIIISATVTATKPTVTVTLQESNAGEGTKDGIYRISRTGSTDSDLTVYFDMSGTASKNRDYTIGNSVTIFAGNSFAYVPLDITDDSEVEPTESATLTLSSNSNYTIGSPSSQTINITDNDVAGGKSFNAVEATPDGQLLALNSKNSSLEVYDSAGMSLKQTLSGISGEDIVLNKSGTVAYIIGKTQVSKFSYSTQNGWSKLNSATVGGSLHGGTYDAVNNRLYVCDWKDGASYIFVLDGTNLSLKNTITSVNYNHAAVAVSSDGRYVYTGNYSNGSITRLDTANNYAATTLSLGSWTGEIAIAPDSNKLYVLLGNDGRTTGEDTGNKVAVVSLSNFNSSGVQYITLPESTYGECRALAVDPSESFLYVLSTPITNDASKDFLRFTTIALSNNTVSSSNNIESGILSGVNSHGLSVDSSGNVYVGTDTGTLKKVVEKQSYPDLVFATTPPTISNNSLVVGSSFTISGTIVNNGNANADASTLAIYRSADNSISTGDVKIADISILPVSLGTSHNFSNSVSTVGWAAGTYYIGSILDVDNKVNEGPNGEKNNISTGAKITITPRQYPDLVFGTDIALSTTVVSVGQSLIVTGSVKNSGSAEAGESTLAIYRSKDSIISANDTKIKDVPVYAIVAKGSLSNSVTISTEGWEAGTYYLGGILDVNDTVDEGIDGEKNNISTGIKITVIGPQAVDDDWKTSPILEATPGNEVKDEWVGFGDKLDYRKLEVNINGSYDLTLSGLENAAKLTIFSVNARGALLSMKSVTVSPKFDKAGNIIGNDSGALTGLRLTAGTAYYVAVEATGASTAKNTSYSLTVGGKQFLKANQAVDDDWKTSPILEATPGNEVKDEWVGFGDKLDYRKLEVNVNGSYDLTLSSLENAAKLTIFSVNARGALLSIKSVTVSPKFDKAGNITGNDTGALTGLLLTAGTEYYVAVEATGSSTAKNTGYTLTIGGTQFDKANQITDDDWKTSPILEATPGNEVKDEWVGFGDKLDYRKLEVNVNGSYDLTLSGLENAAKLTIFSVNARGALLSMKSVTVSPKFDKAGNVVGNDSGALTGLLLTAGMEYYVAVEAPGARNAKNTEYSLTVGGTQFDNPNNAVANNYWGDVEVTELDLAAGLSKEWVGFGDAVDFFQFDLSSEQAGNYGFNLDSDVDKYAALTLYKVTKDKSGKDVLTQQRTNRDSTFLLGEGEYALKVASADNGKGVKNTGYDLSIDLPYLAYWSSQSNLEMLGATELGSGLLENEINKGLLA